MPETKDFKAKKTKAKASGFDEIERPAAAGVNKRRPVNPEGAPEAEALAESEKVQVIEVEAPTQESSSASASTTESVSKQFTNEADPAAFESQGQEKVEIKFRGSELIRAQFPKPFDVAENIATEWVNGGSFDSVKLGHPLVEFAAQKGLQRAKDLEKKVLESPVTEKVVTEALMAGLRAQGFIDQLRSKFKKNQD